MTTNTAAEHLSQLQEKTGRERGWPLTVIEDTRAGHKIKSGSRPYVQWWKGERKEEEDWGKITFPPSKFTSESKIFQES